MAKTANVGRLSISLDANTIRYINNIKKAGLETERRVNMMNKAFSRLKKKSDTSLNKVIGRLGGLAAAYLSVGFAMQKFNQNREMLDQLAKTSDALGINQEKLQALHHVGELNGVTVTQLNLSLQRMQRNLGDAADGTGQTAKALLKLGISIREIEDMSPDKQMELLAKELTSVEKQTDKAKLAQDFFGRNGVRVLKVLEALKKDGLEPTSQALEDMGVNLKRIETKKIEDMNDAIFKVTEVLSGLINRVIIKLAPHLEKFADYFLDLTKETKGFSDQLALSFNIIWRAVLMSLVWFVKCGI